MAHWHKTLFVASQDVTDANNCLQGVGEHPTSDGDTRYCFDVEFDNAFRVVVFIPATNPPQLLAELYDQQDNQLTCEEFHGDIVRNYILSVGDDSYEVTLVREAATTLTKEAVARYNDSPTHCPACGSTDIYASGPQIDGKTCVVEVMCCDCVAHWKDIYGFETISELADDWTPPGQNVAQ